MLGSCGVSVEMSGFACQRDVHQSGGCILCLVGQPASIAVMPWVPPSVMPADTPWTQTGETKATEHAMTMCILQGMGLTMASAFIPMRPSLGKRAGVLGEPYLSRYTSWKTLHLAGKHGTNGSFNQDMYRFAISTEGSMPGNFSDIFLPQHFSQKLEAHGC